LDIKWNEPISISHGENYHVLSTEKIKSRYEFSRYIIDPNKHRFKTVVRIVALVMKFIKNLKLSKMKGDLAISKDLVNKEPRSIQISNEEIVQAENYFYNLQQKK